MKDQDYQDRFFFIASCFLDDKRVMAHAISYFCCVENKKLIYVDLLSCRSDCLVSYLEQIADVLSHKELQEWCDEKQKELDNSNDKFWKNSDEKTLGLIGWKI